MEVALEGGFAADRFRLGFGHHRTVIDAVRHGMQPFGVAAAEAVLQQRRIGARQFADAGNAQRSEFFAGLGADAVDLAHRQRPDARRDVVLIEQRQAVGLFEVGADFRQQLAGADGYRAGESGGVLHRLLDAACEALPVVGQVAQVDVDFVDAAIFDLRCDGRHGRLEQARVMAVGVEIDRQQDRVRRQFRRLHDAHGGEHAQRAGFVGRGGDDAAAGIVAQAEKAPTAVGQQLRLLVAAAADHHGQTAQFGVAQELDGCVEGIHVEVSDAALIEVHAPGTIPETPACVRQVIAVARSGRRPRTKPAGRPAARRFSRLRVPGGSAAQSVPDRLRRAEHPGRRWPGSDTRPRPWSSRRRVRRSAVPG